MQENTTEILESGQINQTIPDQLTQSNVPFFENEDELGSLFKAMQDFVLVIDSNGYYRKIAPTNPGLLYAPAEKLLGRSMHDFFPAEEANDYLEKIREALTTGSTVCGERYVQVQGKPAWFMISLTPMTEDSVILVGRDISERKQAEKALQESEERFRRLAENALEGIVIHDKGEILDANGSFASLFGYTLSEIVGKSLSDFLMPEDFEELRPNFDLNDKTFSGLKLRRKDGSTLHAETGTKLIPYKGRRVRLSVICDITKRVKLEDMLRHEQATLEKRVAERTNALTLANSCLENEIAERKRLEENERKQRILAEALRDSAAAVNSTLDFEEVLDRILANVRQVVEHDVSNIMLIELGIVRIVRCRGYIERGLAQAAGALRLPLQETPNLLWMAQTMQPLIIPDVHDYPGWVKVPDLDWVRSYVGAPICLEGKEVIGFLNLDSGVAGYYTEEHTQRLRAFADQAAIAISNARLYDQAKTLAAVQERQRLARELHDAVSQTLFSANVIAESLPRLLERNPDKARDGLAHLHQLTRAALAEMRTLLLELRPAGLTEKPLNELIHQLVESVTSRTHLLFSFSIDGQQTLPGDVQVALYRITQEALNNVVRHSHAREGWVDLRLSAEKVEISIRDDGRGFDPTQILPDHYGVGIMRERAEGIGASFKIDSWIGKGTEVSVDWSRESSDHDIARSA